MGGKYYYFFCIFAKQWACRKCYEKERRVCLLSLLSCLLFFLAVGWKSRLKKLHSAQAGFMLAGPTQSSEMGQKVSKLLASCPAASGNTGRHPRWIVPQAAADITKGGLGCAKAHTALTSPLSQLLYLRISFPLLHSYCSQAEKLSLACKST